MAVVIPSIPDACRAAIVLISGRTDAQNRVAEIDGGVSERPERSVSPVRRPYIAVEWDGGRAEPADNRIIHARILFRVGALSREHSRYVSAQLHDILMPPEDVAGGLYEYVTVSTDHAGEQRVLLSGAREDAPPRDDLDEGNMPFTVSSYEVTLMLTNQGG